MDFKINSDQNNTELEEFCGLWCRPYNLDKQIIESVIKNEYCINLTEIAKLNGPVMDVGAHVGSFTKFLQNNGYSGQIYAYEAHPQNYKLLEKNKYSFFGDKVIIKAGAVWHNDIDNIYITGDVGYNSGGPSVMINQDDVIKTNAVDFDNEIEKILNETSSNFIDLLKIDCDGAEFPILLNSKRLNLINNIIGEYHNWETEGWKNDFGKLEEHLKSFGFTVFRRSHSKDVRLGLFFATKNNTELIISKEYINMEKYLSEVDKAIDINFNLDSYLETKNWNKADEVGVFYYCWYNTDNWKNMAIRSKYGSPPCGWYYSLDNNIIEKHLDTLEFYNVDFLITSYDGQKEYEKMAIELLAHEANKRCGRVQISLHLELVNVLGDPVSGGENTKKWLKESVDFMYNLYENYPLAIKKIDNKPVIFIYTSRRLMTDLSEIDAMRQYAFDKFGLQLYLVGDEIWWEIKDKNYLSTIIDRSKKFDSIYGYSLFVPNGFIGNNLFIGKDYLNFIEPVYEWFYNNTNVPIMITIKPRFNDSAIRNYNYPIPPQNGKFFMDYYDMTQRYFKGNKNILLITSFNEWYEDTQIEPFVATKDIIPNYDNQANYGDYFLRLIRHFK